MKIKHSILGVFGLIPNKAFITLSFEYKNERYLFVNLHLPHGNKNSKKRSECLKKLMSKYLRPNKKKKFNYFFVMGDFNFRL